MGAAFILPAIGTAMNYFNQRNANERAQKVNLSDEALQNTYRTQALGDVNAQANKIATSNPQAAAAQEGGGFVANLRANQAKEATGGTSPTNFGTPTSALGPTPGANKRYGADTANAASQVQSYGNTNAGEMSAIDTAVNQRKNEALAMQTLGTNLNLLNQKSYQQSFVDRLRAAAVGTPSPWISAAAQAIGGSGQFFANQAPTQGSDISPVQISPNAQQIYPALNPNYFTGGS